MLPSASSRIFRASGSDSERYFQGRLTQDVKGISVGKTRPSLVLSPQGKIQGKLLIHRRKNDFLFVSDPLPSNEALESFQKAILQFKVADDVQVEEIKNSPEIQFFQGSEEDFHIQRILAGEPLFGIDINEKTTVSDIPLDKFVSFDKGCYAGQEVVEMSIARGKPARFFTRFEAKKVSPFKHETPVGDEEGKQIGVITSSVLIPNTERVLSLGFLKNSVSEETKLFSEGVPLEANRIA